MRKNHTTSAILDLFFMLIYGCKVIIHRKLYF